MALSVSELKRFIFDDAASDAKKQAEVGQRYYSADHDILKCRLFYYNADGKLVEDKTRSNIKIVHPFFTELSDQLASYMLSFKDNPIRAKDNAEGLQDHLDERFDDEFWAEIGDLISGAYNKGFEYIYGFKNEEKHIVFQCADSLGVVEVRAKDAEDGQDHIIYYYKDKAESGKKTVRKIMDWTKDGVMYYVQVDDGNILPDDSEPFNPRPHVVCTDAKGHKFGESLGYIPFWRLDYNRNRTSGLRPIKGLIDDYDTMLCALSNNLADFDTPLHVVSGFQGDNLDELQQNLKTKKIVGVDSDGDVQIRTVDIPYQARKAKADEDEKNIYRFGMGFNSSQAGDGNITNVVIRSRYTLLDLKANNLEKRLRRLLKEIVRVVLDEINEENKTDFQIKDIYFDFVREIMTNDTENVQNEKTRADARQIEVNTILNVASHVGDEQTLKAICEIMEWDFEELQGEIKKLSEGQDTADARKILEGVVTDEQAAEISTATISQ